MPPFVIGHNVVVPIFFLFWLLCVAIHVMRNFRSGFLLNYVDKAAVAGSRAARAF